MGEGSRLFIAFKYLSAKRLILVVVGRVTDIFCH